jgi:autotransporter-associated beta strand protein
VGGFAPPNGGGTTVTFDASGATFTPAVDVAYAVNQLIVSGGTPYQFTGSTLSFFGPNAAINLSGAAHGIANDLIFGNLTTFTTSVDVSYAGAMSGGGGLVKAGAGKLTVTNPSPLGVGPLTVNGGILQFGDGVTAPSVLPPNTVTNATIAFGGGPPSIAIGNGLTERAASWCPMAASISSARR